MRKVKLYWITVRLWNFNGDKKAYDCEAEVLFHSLESQSFSLWFSAVILVQSSDMFPMELYLFLKELS